MQSLPRLICVVALLAALAGCGRRGALEAPFDAYAPPPEQAAAPAKPGTKAAQRTTPIAAATGSSAPTSFGLSREILPQDPTIAQSAVNPDADAPQAVKRPSTPFFLDPLL